MESFTKFRKTLTIVACAIALPVARCALAQNTPTAAPLSACGPGKAEFKTSHDQSDGGPTTPPDGKALVYVIEQMPQIGLYTTHVNIGVDGGWIAQLSSKSYTSFIVDPGVHHLCAVYQGQFASSDIGPTILHRLNAEAGKTYYFLYRGLLSKESEEVGFFNEVDEDEGSYALQSSQYLTSTVIKKR